MLALKCVLAGAAAFLIGAGLAAVIRKVAARFGLDVEHAPVWRAPLTFLLATIAIREVLSHDSSDAAWIDDVVHVLDLALIAIVGWVLAVIALFIERALLTRYPGTQTGDPRARHERTKITLITRLTKAVIATLVVVAILWTIPELKEIGIGILASASVLGVIVGLAAQASLGNLFSGLQIAFTDAIRIDDVVVIGDAWGKIEEITLTYVAVRVWDETTLILPCTYFTTTPFPNWTHRATAVTGRVEIAANWHVPIDDLRGELRTILAASEFWDGRTGDLRVDDASGEDIKLLALVSARGAELLEPLRWEVREGLLRFIQQQHPEAIPLRRQESVAAMDASQ